MDEFALPELARRVRPRVVALGNLFRDQLDRYGELEHIAERWRTMAARLDVTTTLVVNADDPVIADLAAGPVSVTQGGVTVTLAITPEAQPELTIHRGEKPLKGVPADVRKTPKVSALLDRRTDLRRQASRVRQSLEAMLVRGDSFSGKELRQLF